MTTTKPIAGLKIPLIYSVNAVCAMEAHFDALDAYASKPVGALRVLIWGGLLHAEPALTLEAAGDIMDACIASGASLADVAQGCLDALSAAGFAAPEGA